VHRLAVQYHQGQCGLTPETADTTDVGVVLQPRFFPGFSASVDYWNIDLSNAIASPSLNQILVFCQQGHPDLL
jgi:iron complex outermembrane receptor protein